MEFHELLNECLAAIKNGDETKFYDLVQLTYGPLKSVAKRYLNNESHARAVVSEVYEKIYRYAARYDTSKKAFTYLWQIVKHKAYDYNKKEKHKTVNIDDISLFDQTDHYERVDTKMDVERAVTLLKNPDKQIVEWTFNHDMTQEEIAQRLGISKSAVCQRLSKAKKKLSKYFDDAKHFERPNSISDKTQGEKL